MARRVSGLLVFAVCAFAQNNPALNRITPESLRASVTYLASDELEGRFAPSPGLDKAADYIAGEFKKAGLAPVDGSYFQIGAMPNGAPAKNVVGLLRGSDPVLRDSYIIVSAHYDHVGVATQGDDRIFNGANDDASGVATVIDLAKAMLAARPQRSILFITFYGEEQPGTGLWGSKFYGQHPLVPLTATIAQLNFELMGRPDAATGLQMKSANLTGFDMSDLPEMLANTAETQGVRIWKDAASSDAFFGRSDNQSLADLGIPAHTVSVAYSYADYHKVSDSADKLDYENMAAVDRAIAAGLLKIANDPNAPAWNESYEPAQKYVEAARKLHAAPATTKAVE